MVRPTRCNEIGSKSGPSRGTAENNTWTPSHHTSIHSSITGRRGRQQDNDEENGAPAAAPPASERLTIRVPGRYHPRAPPVTLTDDPAENIPSNLVGDETDDAPPSSQLPLAIDALRPSARALLAFSAFEQPAKAFTATPSTPDPRTIQDALGAPDANEWRAAMDTEIDNMRRLNVFRSVPRPPDTNIITPRWGILNSAAHSSTCLTSLLSMRTGHREAPGRSCNTSHIFRDNNRPHHQHAAE
jgi:hypothetical protein